MTVRFATATEIEQWDTLLLAGPEGNNVFSSYEYANIKVKTGYIPRFLVVDELAVTVLEKTTPPLGKLWYIPKGPNVQTSKELMTVLESLRQFARRRGVFAIRVETELDRSAQPTLERHGLRKAKPIIPNASTITLDISDSLDDVLLRLPQKGRHAIRKAERDGVTVKQVASTDDHCQLMYQLLSDTAKGQFGIRAYSYYKYFWQTFSKAKLGQLFFAYYEGQVVAGAYAMTFGSKSTYKDGASIRQRTTYGASHFLQWQVITWAKSKGSKVHDFCGSPPSESINDPEHPHHGIGLFKTAFNKQVTDYIGCYDFVIQSLQYALWTKLGERVHRKVYFYRTKDFYY